MHETRQGPALPMEVLGRWVAARRPAAGFGAILIAVALIGALVAIPSTNAAFTDVTGNSANSIASDTLDPPTALIATDGVSITLDWTATGDSYADGYRIFRSASAGGPYAQIADITSIATVSYVDSPAEGTYYYVARAYAGTWESAYSNETAGRAWRPFDCPVDPDLRACIRFDTDLGGTYADESGYGNTVIHSGGSQVPGVSGNAADGSPAARYEMLDSASLDLTDFMTIEGWLRYDSLPASGRAGIVDNDGQYSLFLYAGTGLRCSNGPDQLPHVPVPVGVWFHAACAWDGATLTLYFDGMPVATMASTGTIGTVNTEPVSVLNSSPVFDEPMDGAIDNLRIWHSGRTQAQICADAGITGC